MSTAMDIDRPLEDLIKSRPKARRGGRGGPRSTGPRSTGPRAAGAASAPRAAPAAGRAPRAAAAPVPAQKQAAAEAFKVIVSNLPDDVEERAVRDLFLQTVGPVSSATLAYNSKGKSTGVATVIFRNKGDAQKAFDMYNNRMIDQKRPLKVEVVVDPSKVPLGSRLAPLAAAPVAQTARGGVARRGAAPKRGRGAARAPARPRKTQEELDKEMTDYQTQASTTA